MDASSVVRETIIHWDWLVYLEMFLAGTAAGAYLTAVILELRGRGDSPLARLSHLIAFPLMAVAGLLLTFDLTRPERFWHMILQSKTLLPMFKWWAPMSMGSWAVLLFSGFAFVSFVDALAARGYLRRFGWPSDWKLHASPFGLIWAIFGGMTAFFVEAYSGVLLTVTSIPGWMDSPLLGALFLSISGATGTAALLLIQALWRRADPITSNELERANTLILVWLSILLAAFLVMARGNAHYFLSGLPLLAIIGAATLIAITLLLRLALRPARTPAIAALMVLVGGFLLRYAVVIGPQNG